ncbi:hypothetical protein [Streptomyces sp. NPDC058613]|uniref:hypothetical protein n=1 Tax=Streptomyces sp. NPDC058613 TaxID=3346556 RepID=UPI0036547CCF
MATASRRPSGALGLDRPGRLPRVRAPEEILNVALRGVREDERDGYVQRLEAFAEQHRKRLQKRCMNLFPQVRAL